ncbi:hypothetical protein PIB30_091673 [Stylosanthes scabra]|uniref:Uncharacterized protein n=1 Tax=Stylosanthes scabra TaxID=79078 RepID=A0ABU6VT51_9FABA|nr:hypothetical protein [Stylosanthes scabra]
MGTSLFTCLKRTRFQSKYENGKGCNRSRYLPGNLGITTYSLCISWLGGIKAIVSTACNVIERLNQPTIIKKRRILHCADESRAQWAKGSNNKTSFIATLDDIPSKELGQVQHGWSIPG